MCSFVRTYVPGQSRCDFLVHRVAVVVDDGLDLEELVRVSGVGGPRVEVGPAPARARVHHNGVAVAIVALLGHEGPGTSARGRVRGLRRREKA